MVKQDLLNKALEWVGNGKELKPMKYNRDFVYNLFKKYKNYGMTISSYCCYGDEQCCWQDPYAEGIWSMNLKEVKNVMWDNIKSIQPYIRERRKGERFYIYKDNNICIIYIYCRDNSEVDYYLWFSNGECLD